MTYHIEKSSYGIITLIVNTVERWSEYRLIDSHLSMSFQSEDSILVIPLWEFGFDVKKELHYQKLEAQNKDQVAFYWVPIRLIKESLFNKLCTKKEHSATI